MFGQKYMITADYQDDKVFYRENSYPSGYFVIQLLNNYWLTGIDELSAVPRPALQCLPESLDDGIINKKEFAIATREILDILKYLPQIPPFDTMRIEDERECIPNLLGELNQKRVADYFEMRAQLASADGREGILPLDEDQRVKYDIQKKVFRGIIETTKEYQELVSNIRLAARAFVAFEERLSTIAKLDEKHMLPLALEVLGHSDMQLSMQYVPIKKSSRSNGATVARRLYFDNYLSFILTDFYEGLHYGHYPRMCPICGRYFMMTSARRQMYCDGIAPEKYRGKQISCRKLAAVIGRKELAENDPVIDLYTRRCAAIRTEKHRGTISEEMAQAAKKLAKDHKYRALQDESYAQGQYLEDMRKENIYEAARKSLK